MIVCVSLSSFIKKRMGVLKVVYCYYVLHVSNMHIERYKDA